MLAVDVSEDEKGARHLALRCVGVRLVHRPAGALSYGFLQLADCSLDSVRHRVELLQFFWRYDATQSLTPCRSRFYFLDELYRSLETHTEIRTATFSEVLADPDSESESASAALIRPLPELVSGSWVYGDLSTWIGSEQKNRAWDLLASAKQSYNLVMASGRLNDGEMQAASRQLAICYDGKKQVVK